MSALPSAAIEVLLEQARRTAQEAGRFLQGRPSEWERKNEEDSLASTIVTDIDLKAQELIVNSLPREAEGFSIGLLTEESPDDGSRHRSPFFWAIDPLDGTLAFVEGRAGYAVSIALVDAAGIPLVGAVFDPVAGDLFSAARGGGLFRNARKWAVPSPGRQLRIFADRSFTLDPRHENLWRSLERLAYREKLILSRVEVGRGAVMNAIAVLEQGPALYFKRPKAERGGGHVWDFAATACLFGESAAVCSDLEGRPLDLNRRGSTFMNHRGVLFASSPEVASWIRTLAQIE